MTSSTSNAVTTTTACVIDVDSHFQEPITWLVDIAPDVARACPGSALLRGMANFVGNDPEHPPETPFWAAMSKWSVASTLADAVQLAENEATARYFSNAPFSATGRISWLDQEGIQHQVCNPTVAVQMAYGVAAASPPLAGAIVSAYNEWALSASGPSGRLHPTAMMNPGDPLAFVRDGAIMAAAGSRTVLIPVDERVWSIITDPSSDALWAALDDWGMSPLLHLGVTGPTAHRLPLSAASWADSSIRAQRCLLRWVASRGAQHHRSLVLLVAELGLDWALPWLANLERAEATSIVAALGSATQGGRTLAQVAREQVAWVPLPRDPIEQVRASPDCPLLAFGSDYPHREGWGEGPVAHAASRGVDARACWRWPTI